MQKTRRLYLRNDDPLYSFTDITLTAVDSATPSSATEARNGYSWKLIEGDDQPSNEKWDIVTPGNTIALVDVGTVTVSDIATYLPFWVRVAVPSNSYVQAITTVKLDISCTSITL